MTAVGKPEASDSTTPPVAPPLPANRSSGNTLALVAIVAVLLMGLVGAVTIVVCAGLVFFLAMPAPPSGVGQVEPQLMPTAPPAWEPEMAGGSVPWTSDSPTDSATYSPEAASAPTEGAYDSTGEGAAFGYLYDDGPPEEYDPDWQLELPEYQQEANRELQQDYP